MQRIADLHGKVAPLEAELAQIEQAKTAISRPIKQFTFGSSKFGEPFWEHAPASTALGQFITRHEQELTDQIGNIRDALGPLEGELSEVRRAKAAIGIQRKGPEEVDIRVPAIVNTSSFGEPRIEEVPRSPYAHLTMKQLIVKVLREHFHAGATTRQMLDFFRDAWGRDIERTNLSPQISRLYQEGIIGREDGTKCWYIVPDERLGKRPYRLLQKAYVRDRMQRAGDVVWLTPAEVAEHHELLERDPAVDPDPDED